MATVRGYDIYSPILAFRNYEVLLSNKFDVVAGKDEDPKNLWLTFYDGTPGNGKFVYKGVEQPAQKGFNVPLSDLGNLKFIGAGVTTNSAVKDDLYVATWAFNTKTKQGTYGAWQPFSAFSTSSPNFSPYAKITDIKFDKSTGDWLGAPFKKLYKDLSFTGLTDPSKLFVAATVVEVKDPLIAFTTSSEWRPGAATYVYAHGWNDGPAGIRTEVIKNALTQKYGKDANIVIVDWQKLSGDTSGGYPQPILEASVTKQVGESVAAALLKSGADISKTHLIGHSLGSFVMAAAAEHINATTGQKVKELVALDTAFGSYDIDARLPGAQQPLAFTKDLALTTRSYTVSDLADTISIAGDNDRAATADYAYLIQYLDSGAYLWDAPAASTLAHVGVNGIYADLISKGILDYNSAYTIKTMNKFDSKGKLNINGPFDGVIVADEPWSTDPKLTLQTMTMTQEQREKSGIAQEYWFKMPKAVGWADGYQNSFIYGSHENDVMFFDRFDNASVSTKGGIKLVGGRGDDIIIGRSIVLSKSQDTKNGLVDQFWGSEGSDKFVFGYKVDGGEKYPYKEKWDIDIFGKGLNAYSVIKDFSVSEDKLQFIWSKEQIGYKNGSDIDQALVKEWGQGIGILANEDLIVYLPGISSSQAQSVLNDSTKTSYLTYTDLAGWLFHA